MKRNTKVLIFVLSGVFLVFLLFLFLIGIGIYFFVGAFPFSVEKIEDRGDNFAIHLESEIPISSDEIRINGMEVNCSLEPEDATGELVVLENCDNGHYISEGDRIDLEVETENARLTLPRVVE